MPNTKPVVTKSTPTALVIVFSFAWLLQFVLIIVVLTYVAVAVSGMSSVSTMMQTYIEEERAYRQKHITDFDRFQRAAKEFADRGKDNQK